MKTRNFSFTIVLSLFFLFGIFSNLYSQYSVLNAGWELGVKAVDSWGSAISVPVKVYIFDEASRNLELYKSGSTISGQGFPNNDTNGWADIGDNNSVNPMFRLPGGGNYYIKIGTGYFIMTFMGGTAYGDMKFLYNNGSLSLDYNSSDYEIDGPFTWTDRTIILKNNFGNDASSCFGNIHLNSVTLSNVGLSGTQQKREDSTFPHTIAGEDNQTVNNFARKWRNWVEDGITDISTTISTAQNLTRTAKYAKQVNATLTNDFGGGTIKVNSTSYSSGSTAYLYDDANYTITAPYQTVNWVNFVFDHWSGTYNGTQNPLTYNKPDSDKNLTAYYIGTANQSPMSIHYTSSNGQPISLAWTDHPNPDVTQYQVWRTVTGVSTLAIATLNRGTTSYTDYSYTQNPNGAAKLFYTVKAYYAPSGTWNDPAYLLNRGDFTIENIVNNNDQLNASVKELPTEYSIGNYPNPFNPTTTINYQLPENSFVTIKVYDILGKEITTLVNESKSAGYHNVSFDASKLTSGIYIYTINAGNPSAGSGRGFIQSKKMILMK